MGIKAIPIELQYAKENLRWKFEQRKRQKETFLQQYGTLLIGVTFVVMVGLMFWFIADKINDNMATANQVQKLNADVLTQIKSVVVSLNNIQNSCGSPTPNSNPSGYVEVGIT